jgi:hypothetical protein
VAITALAFVGFASGTPAVTDAARQVPELARVASFASAALPTPSPAVIAAPAPAPAKVARRADRPKRKRASEPAPATAAAQDPALPTELAQAPFELYETTEVREPRLPVRIFRIEREQLMRMRQAPPPQIIAVTTVGASDTALARALAERVRSQLPVHLAEGRGPLRQFKIKIKPTIEGELN